MKIKKHKCPYCGEIFALKWILENHIKNHHKNQEKKNGKK